MDKETDALFKKRVEAKLTEIAKENLHVETLEPRGRDGLDFYDCSVHSLKAALMDAYCSGLAVGLQVGMESK